MKNRTLTLRLSSAKLVCASSFWRASWAAIALVVNEATSASQQSVMPKQIQLHLPINDDCQQNAGPDHGSQTVQFFFEPRIAARAKLANGVKP